MDASSDFWSIDGKSVFENQMGNCPIPFQYIKVHRQTKTSLDVSFLKKALMIAGTSATSMDPGESLFSHSQKN